jgi:CheY-like chemotaxis protein
MTRLLLVEDDRDIVSKLTEFLEGEGFSVDSARGQSEALGKLDNNRYDLILLDKSLADGNGFAVCSAVRSGCGSPVVFLTASGDEYSVVADLIGGGRLYKQAISSEGASIPPAQRAAPFRRGAAGDRARRLRVDAVRGSVKRTV